MELTEDELLEARHWIDDSCGWFENLEQGDAYELSDSEVEHIVKNFYSDGIEGFKYNCIPH